MYAPAQAKALVQSPSGLPAGHCCADGEPLGADAVRSCSNKTDLVRFRSKGIRKLGMHSGKISLSLVSV